MDVTGPEILPNITLRHKLKKRNSAFIAVILSAITVGSSTTNISHSLR